MTQWLNAACVAVGATLAAVVTGCTAPAYLGALAGGAVLCALAVCMWRCIVCCTLPSIVVDVALCAACGAFSAAAVGATQRWDGAGADCMCGNCSHVVEGGRAAAFFFAVGGALYLWAAVRTACGDVGVHDGAALHMS